MDEPNDQQPAQPPVFEYEDRLVPIGTDPDELRELADAIVRGASIAYARIADLRAIVDAVMAHPGATLAPVQDAEAKKRREPARLRAKQHEALTKVRVHRSLIEEDGAACSNLDVRCTLDCRELALHGDAGFRQTAFHGDLAFADTTFHRDAGFEDVTFNANASFRGAAFHGHAEFWRADFRGRTDFGIAEFHADADFDGAAFHIDGDFMNATFHGGARFESTKFHHGGDFSEAAFYARANFEKTVFHSNAGFDYAAFHADARFRHAVFHGGAGFWNVLFYDDAVFRNVDFRADAGFRNATFRGGAVFIESVFHGGLTGDLRRGQFRMSSFAEAAPICNAKEQPKEAPLISRMLRCLANSFGWQHVRPLAGFALLNHASLFALITIPILAAIHTIDDRIPIGTSLVITYLAALFVTLGRFIYQSAVPSIIQRFDEDAFVDDLMQRYAKGESAVRQDGLRRATEALARIAKIRPDRHPNLVSHHGETVWMPPKEHIEWFEDEVEPTEVAETTPTTEKSDELENENTSDSETQRIPANQLFGYVPGEERARIALEEGARAEYWLKARNVQEIDRGSAAGGRALRDPEGSERVAAAIPKLALISGGLYALGVLALLLVLLGQVFAVMRAAGWIG